MSRELTVRRTDDLPAAVARHDITDLIQPLVKEIHLFDTVISGTSRIDDRARYDALQEGQALTLRREETRFDERAIAVLNAKNQKRGYIPEKDNEIFARLMDAGKLLRAKVISVTEHSYFFRVRIGIYLVDY